VRGNAEDEAAHATAHDEFANGFPLDDWRRHVVTVIEGMPVIEVVASAPQAIRDQVACLALLAHRETPSFRAGYYGADEAQIDRRAYATIVDGRASAFLVVELGSRSWPALWIGNDIYLARRNADEGERRVVQRVWVASKYRRKGLAKALVNGVLGHLRTTYADAAWEGPFTSSGHALIRSLCPETFMLSVGEVGDLTTIVAGVIADDASQRV
jgi:GNAT superfamily N-acetyltransferase